MTIFNSLGSNYDFGFVLNSLFASNDEKHRVQLEDFLKKKYQGETFLVYKGREALRLALRISNQKGSTVAICGFTCYAVYDAVVKEGYEVEYLDIEENSLNFSFETLKQHVKNNPQIKTVIVQNTLGYSCNIEKIAEFCKEKNIILIEDLAHSIGTIYKNGKEAGTIGAFTVLSFSQDKVVDGVSGGALILRNKNFKFPISNFQFQVPNKKKQLIDRFYPLFTYKIRKTYASGFGKILHLFLKTFHLLSNPMDESSEIHDLPNWYCDLIYKEFKAIEKNLDHRRKIAKIYYQRLTKKLFINDFEDQISLSTNLRFPVYTEKREDLIHYLKKQNIFVSDIWYDSPIAPKKYLHLTDYKNQCPQSEKIAALILNLPTHRNVSEKDARRIADVINQWETLH